MVLGAAAGAGLAAGAGVESIEARPTLPEVVVAVAEMLDGTRPVIVHLLLEIAELQRLQVIASGVVEDFAMVLDERG